MNDDLYNFCKSYLALWDSYNINEPDETNEWWARVNVLTLAQRCGII